MEASSSFSDNGLSAISDKIAETEMEFSYETQIFDNSALRLRWGPNHVGAKKIGIHVWERSDLTHYRLKRVSF